MERPNLEILFEKVRSIAHGPHAALLNKLIDLLYEREIRAAAIRGEADHQPCGYPAPELGL